MYWFLGPALEKQTYEVLDAVKASGSGWQTQEMIARRLSRPFDLMDICLILMLVRDGLIEVKCSRNGRKGYRNPITWYRAREHSEQPEPPADP